MKFPIYILLFACSILQAQHSIKGNFTKSNKQKWAILYKIEGAQQRFKQGVEIDPETSNSFEFKMPSEAETGMYRISYTLNGSGFVDLLYNKEDIELSFDPANPTETLTFSKSLENTLYQGYQKEISTQQQILDSLQVAYLKAPSKALEATYLSELKTNDKIQKDYLEKSKGLLVNSFVKATKRYNAPQIAKDPDSYLKGMLTHYFDDIDMENEILYNSSFLVDRITDYVFYLNYSEDPETQRSLHTNAVNTVLEKINKPAFKKEMLEYLIGQFTNLEYATFVDSLFATQYQALPEALQDPNFKNKIMQQLTVAVGRTAPDIEWKEDTKELQLSSLDEAKNYVLIFWSTGCSHCLHDIPKLYSFSKDKKQTSFIAFSLEENSSRWDKKRKSLGGWHHILGLNKWKNQTARTYQVYSTPSYFILDSDKTIIAKPKNLKELKEMLNVLN